MKIFCERLPIKNSNSKQMDSNIDARVIEKISNSKEYVVLKSDSLVFANGEIT